MVCILRADKIIFAGDDVWLVLLVEETAGIPTAELVIHTEGMEQALSCAVAAVHALDIDKRDRERLEALQWPGGPCGRVEGP